MGGSGVGPSKGIDPSVGGLVWVRRRNGSWWPGRILGQDELPENSLSMPRLGTPVKLLGREDASVDWYNLERSKRVKAFRCGEYDDCIEKAKALASHSSKKAAKYARREDAIIHALELESARLGKEHPHFSDRPNTYGEHPHVHESSSSFQTNLESNDYVDGNLSSCDVLDSSCSTEESENDFVQEESHTGLSIVKSDLVDAAKEVARRWRNPNDSEDDGTEGARRMKGLEDLGLGVASSLRRKRSLVDHVHEFLKKKNRRRTLTKVLESTPRLPVRACASSSPNESCFLEGLDCRVSGLESNELKKYNSLVIDNSGSMTVSCENGTSLNASKHVNNTSVRCKLKEKEACGVTLENNSLEGLFHVPLVAQGFSKIVSVDSPKARIGAAAESSPSSHVETPSLGNGEHNESGSTSTGAAYIHDISQSIDKGASEWQLKGKRNSRSRKSDADIEAAAGLCGTLMSESYSCKSNNRPRPETNQVECSHGWSWSSGKDSRAEGSTPEPMVPQRSLPYRQSRFMLNPKYDTSEFSLRHHNSSSGLYDVPVEAKGSYRPQCVPYISLMSRLNGRPVVGHPLVMEKLSGGMYDDLIRNAKCLGSNSGLDTSDYRDVNIVHGKRPHGIALSKHHHLQARSSQTKYPRSRQNAILSKKIRKSSSKHRHLQARSLQTKSPRSRQNSLLSKKIRKLSSLTSSKRSKEKRGPIEKLKGPCIACIPLNVVFTRIMAAMNSSTRPSARLTATNDIYKL